MFHEPDMPRIRAQDARSKVLCVKRFREHVKAQYRSEMQNLSNTPDNSDPEYLDALVSERDMLDDVLNLADQLAIVSLYRVVELSTARLMKSALPTEDPKKFSTIRGLSQVLQDRFNVDLKQVPFYASIDELRLTNNAIKHEGKVTADLAGAYASWVKGEELAGLETVFERIAPDVPKYIEALARQLT